jgi:hypothetical protein
MSAPQKASTFWGIKDPPNVFPNEAHAHPKWRALTRLFFTVGAGSAVAGSKAIRPFVKVMQWIDVGPGQCERGQDS